MKSLSKYAVLATCNLNQWAMSFKHNKTNIIKSIDIARQHGATYRLGPELEISGYGCEDHFQELDTVRHSWQILAELLADQALTKDMICDFGMPVYFKNAFYNCRIICLDSKILLIRPKMFLALDLNYREGRWFTPWLDHGSLDEYFLDERLQMITG